MYNNLHVAPATKDDITQLVELINSAYRGESSKEGWTNEADLLGGLRTDEQDLEHLLLQQGNTMLVCTGETNNLLGCVYLQLKGSVMYLGMLTVWPKLQAKGIGKHLLVAAEDFAKQHNCNTIEMTVISVRRELVAWYNKRGYQATGDTKPFPPDSKFGISKKPLEFIVLSKSLG